MCDNKVHAQAACAPDKDMLSMARAQSGRNRARTLLRARPTLTPTTRASPALHAAMEDVLGLQDAPKQ